MCLRGFAPQFPSQRARWTPSPVGTRTIAHILVTWAHKPLDHASTSPSGTPTVWSQRVPNESATPVSLGPRLPAGARLYPKGRKPRKHPGGSACPHERFSQMEQQVQPLQLRDAGAGVRTCRSARASEPGLRAHRPTPPPPWTPPARSGNSKACAGAGHSLSATSHPTQEDNARLTPVTASRGAGHSWAVKGAPFLSRREALLIPACRPPGDIRYYLFILKSRT